MKGKPPVTPDFRGRATASNPPNRFDPIEVGWEPEWLESEYQQGVREHSLPTRFWRDTSREALSRNDSPDVQFDFGLNPYRGCEHGCAYCYARPSHEFLGFSAGLDFESQIVVKEPVAELLEKKLRSRSWKPQVVALSGNTDCYQPVERKLELTRRCLEVFLKYRNPVEVITKSALVVRDLEILAEMARFGLVRVTLSVTTLEPGLAACMEPRAAAPSKRLEAIERLTAAGVPVCINAAPVIPGLTDHEMPAILAEGAARGARWAKYIMVRLPHGVKEMFGDWLERHYPDRAGKVTTAIREVRGGELTDSRWGVRMRGEGPRAETLAQLFALHCKRNRLNATPFLFETGHFRKEVEAQQSLFDEGV